MRTISREVSEKCEIIEIRPLKRRSPNDPLRVTIRVTKPPYKQSEIWAEYRDEVAKYIRLLKDDHEYEAVKKFWMSKRPINFTTHKKVRFYEKLWNVIDSIGGTVAREGLSEFLDEVQEKMEPIIEELFELDKIPYYDLIIKDGIVPSGKLSRSGIEITYPSEQSTSTSINLNAKRLFINVMAREIPNMIIRDINELLWNGERYVISNYVREKILKELKNEIPGTYETLIDEKYITTLARRNCKLPPIHELMEKYGQEYGYKVHGEILRFSRAFKSVVDYLNEIGISFREFIEGCKSLRATMRGFSFRPDSRLEKSLNKIITI